MNNGRIEDDWLVHEANGFDGAFYEGLEVDLAKDRFLRIEYYDADDSRRTWQTCVDAGLVDKDGVRLFDLAQVDDMLDDWKAEHSDDILYPAMATGQLRVVWATHRFSGQFAPQDRDFFASNL